jgi:hypothetical protein
MNRLWERREVNLVERPEWEDYDTAAGLSDVVFNNMAEDVHHLEEEDIGSLAHDVLNAAKKGSDWLSDREQEELFKAFQKHENSIEGFFYMVSDTYSWAWENAYIPDESDVRQAGDDAILALSQQAYDWISSYDALWDVAEYFGKKPQDFMKELLDNYIDYQQKEGHYDRFFVFDPLYFSRWAEQIVKKGAIRESGGPLDWKPPPDITKEDLVTELKNFLNEMEEPFLVKMFAILKKHMDEIDHGNRMNFRKTWHKMLKDDPKRVKSTAKELKGFLEGVNKGYDDA